MPLISWYNPYVYSTNGASDQTLIAPQKDKERNEKLLPGNTGLIQSILNIHLHSSIGCLSHNKKEEAQPENIFWKKNQKNCPVNKIGTYTGKKNYLLPHSNYNNIQIPLASILYNLPKNHFQGQNISTLNFFFIKKYRNTSLESNRKIFSS